MRRMRLGEQAVGFALAEAPTDGGGRPLMPGGTVLEASGIARLQVAGVQTVFVEDEAFRDMVFTSLVSAQTRRLAAAVFREAREKVRTQPTVPIPYAPFLRLAHAVAQDVHETPLDRASLMQNAHSAERDEVHALNRAGLGAHLCNAMRMPRYAHDVIVAGLVCDLGMLALPEDVRWEDREITPEEQAAVQAHVPESVSLIGAREGWTAVARTAVSQHHERVDGSGYPHGLKGDEIHFAARALAVCDVFAEMLLERAGRPTLSPEEALAEVDGSAGSLFDYDVVVAFHRMVPPFPVGTEVELSTGERAVVLRVPLSLKQRPLVRVFADREGRRLEAYRDLDLGSRDQQATTVVRVIS